MAKIDSMVWLSKREAPASFTELCNELTVVPRQRRTTAIERDSDTGEDKWVTRLEEAGNPIECFRISDDGNLLGVPIDWARQRGVDFSTLHDCTVRGSAIEVPKLPNPHHPAAPNGQADFFEEVAMQVKHHYSCLAQAPTGAGKTVTVLNTIGRAKRTALVIVPNTGLAEQWKKEITLHLGIQPDKIGMVGNGSNRWRDCSITIAIINSVVMKDMPDEFYDYFGFVAWDEAHRLGAQEFSKSMTFFPARYKLAVTATPRRKDGMDDVVFNYFGEPSAIAEAPALSVTCWRVQFPLIGNLSWLDRCRNDMKPIKWLSGLKKRNEMLADLIADLYKKGRHVIVLSRFIEHLEVLHGMVRERGVPDKVMGAYTGTWKGSKLGKGYLEKVRKEAQVQFATYSKAKEGYDCPRLDAGIEATPVADNIQGIGRVRRPFKNKQHPLWFTVEDLNVNLFARYTQARLRGFEKTNVNVKTLTGQRLP